MNPKWYGDGTEINTDEGKLFLDSVLDMGSRRIVGFPLDEHHDAELAEAALDMAVAVRGGNVAIAGVIMHTDQGSRYTAGHPGRLQPVRYHPVDGRGQLVPPNRLIAVCGGTCPKSGPHAGSSAPGQTPQSWVEQPLQARLAEEKATRPIITFLMLRQRPHPGYNYQLERKLPPLWREIQGSPLQDRRSTGS